MKVVVITRPGTDFRSRRADGSLVVTEGRTEDLSSTKLRKLIEQKASVEKYVPPGVVEYLRNNNLL